MNVLLQKVIAGLFNTGIVALIKKAWSDPYGYEFDVLPRLQGILMWAILASMAFLFVLAWTGNELLETLLFPWLLITMGLEISLYSLCHLRSWFGGNSDT